MARREEPVRTEVAVPAAAEVLSDRFVTPAAEFAPLAWLAPQFGFSVVGFRRMAAAGKVPGARLHCGRWVVHLPTLRAHFAVEDSSGARDTVPVAPAPRRRGRPRSHSDLDRVYSS